MIALFLSWLSLATAAPLPPHVAIQSGVCSKTAMQNFRPATGADHLALARCQLKAGHPALARESLQSIKSSPLSPYVGLVRAEILITEGSFSQAADLLSGLKLTGDAADRARMLRGRALVEAGRYSEARPVLSGMLEGSRGAAGVLATPGGADPAEIRWWLAEGAVRRGAPEKAIPVYRTIWARNPTSARADQAAKALGHAGHPVPDGSSSEGRALVRERISALEKLHLYGDAWQIRQHLPPDGTNAGHRAAARSLFKAKDYPQAVVMYARIASPSTQDRFDHALAMSRTGDYGAAAKLYEKVTASNPSHKLADTASYKLGYLAYDEGRLTEAIPLLRRHLERYPESRHADEARWFIGWSQFRLGDYTAAEDSLGTLLMKHPRSGLAAAARYWQARIAGIQGRPETAKTGYEEVLRRWPQSGYAWWSAERLGTRYDGAASFTRPALPAVLDSQGYALGLELARAGLKNWARAELRPYKSKVQGNRVASLTLAEALVEAGDYVGAKALAQKYCGTPGSSSADPWAIRLCWPRPEVGALDPELAAWGLPAHLPYSIMTAESALKPWVTSPAGARGLMQLMPELAATLHGDRFPGSPYDPDQLYQPAYNAMLGVTELGELQGHFGSDRRIRSEGVSHAHLPLAIAGYNGGKAAVERWLSAESAPIAPDVFMENIGYTETRRYVRKVLGYMQTYRLVYGE